MFMVIHLWGKFWMAAWRGRRALTWITGRGRVPGLDWYCVHRLPVQTNFDSQWISFEAKDGLNAVGVGAFFNVTNFGRCSHACCLMPLVVGFLVVWHVLLVRRRGVVPPLEAVSDDASRTSSSRTER